MNQTIFKSPLERPSSDNTESDRSFPPSKRLCNSSSTSKVSSSSSNVEQISNGEQKITNGCQLCGRIETRLLQINCPSLHHFCVNCIFSGTQDHIQNNTAPKCLVIDCEYALETNDLETLPISVRDYQTLSKLIELPVQCINKNPENLRVKCDKCHLYIDQYNFYLHHKECAGREATLPCETCFCPVLLTDYSEHFLICQNENQATLVQFLLKHVQDPSANEQKIKSFIKSWQRKSRRSIDVYEIIDEFNQTDGLVEPICDGCKLKVPFDQYHIINCTENHSICLPCYEQHIKDQMKNGLILTCSQCNYHLQDKDLAEIRTLSSAEIQVCQNYQDRKMFESYNLLFGDDETNLVETTSQPNYPRRTVTSSSSSSSTGNLNGEEQSRRKCERCSKFWSYEDIFVLHCDCKICYDCFEDEMNEQRTKNTLLGCPFCSRTVDHNDLGNLRLKKQDIQSIQVYQQSRLFEMEHSNYIERSRANEKTNTSQAEADDNDDEDPNADLELLLFTQKKLLPKYWELPMLTNFSRHLIDQESAEYKFVSDRFFESWNRMPIMAPQPPPALRPPVPPIPPSQNTTPMNPSLVPPYFLPVPPVPYRGLSSSISSMPSSFHPVNIPTVNNQLNPSASSSCQNSNLLSILPSSYSSPPNNNQPLPHFPGQLPSATALNSSASMNAMNSSNLSTNNPNFGLHQPTANNVFPPPPRPPPIAFATSGPGPSSTQSPSLPPFLLPPPAHQHLNSISRMNLRAVMQQTSHRNRRAPFNSITRGATLGSRSDPLPINRLPQIRSIERIQNQRWFKQYSAHDLEFRQKLGKQTLQWLFHGCNEQASKNITMECFNRSYAGQHAVAFGHGCYFAQDSLYSDGFAPPDAQGLRRMFLVRVLVGNTTVGNSTMRVAPAGYDSTGDGRGIFVTYHDSQAYAEYLITYQR